MSNDKKDELTPTQRLRRVVLLCCGFMRNLACHRAGRRTEIQDNLFNPHHPQGAFWLHAHNNFIDACILDWCKLFAERKGEHHWRRVVGDPDRFEADLYTTLGVTAAEFAELITKVKRYRNKFVAHLDQDGRMHPPKLDLPKKSVAFLHERLTQEASSFEDWRRLPTSAEQLDGMFVQASEAAESVYREALRWTAKMERS
jgi:hypothetical protein